MTGRGAVPGGAGPSGGGDPRRDGDPLTCEDFREVVEELALGGVDDPRRARLHAHAAACPACQARLDELALLVDRLLLAAPELEPPAGFVGRVLDHLATAAAGAPRPRATGTATTMAKAGGVATRRDRRRRRPLLVAAAVVVLVAFTGGLLLGIVGRGEDGSAPQAASTTSASAPAGGAPAGAGEATVQAISSGPILRADGTRSGTAMLVEQPRPLVLVTIDSPRPSANRVSCELVLADGTATTVGTWGYSDVAGGAWAAGIAPELLGAVRMNVRDASGLVVASAALA